VLEPKAFPDDRGGFHEWFRGAGFREATGQDLHLAQANCSVSKRGTLRGIHFADVPRARPSTSRVYVVRSSTSSSISASALRRTGSGRRSGSTTGPHHAVHLSEGLGHAFLALTDDATVVYLCSEGYAPGREHGIHPLDPDLAIEWPAGIEPLLSPKDEQAPTLAVAEAQGLLLAYEDCVAHRRTLRGA